MPPLRDPYTGQFIARTFTVTVWDMRDGDIAKYATDATQDEVDAIECHYDEPFYEVEIEESD